MGLLNGLFGEGIVRPLAEAGTKVVEDRGLTRRTEVVADSINEQAKLENAQAINAGRSTWRPKWMDAIRRLLTIYFTLSFIGAMLAFLALISIFAGWSHHDQWAQIVDDLTWLLKAWATLGSSLITVATWSFLGYSPFRSMQDIAQNGADDSLVTKAIKRVMPGTVKQPAAVITRQEMSVPGEIDRLDGIVVPGADDEDPEPVQVPLDVKQLSKDLQRDEGVVYHIYRDTKNNRTAGIGHLLTKSDIEYNWPDKTAVSKDRVKQWFRTDITKAIAGARSVVSNFDQLPHDARLVLCNMCFQMGTEGLRDFRKTIPLIEQMRWQDAAVEMLDSEWFRDDSPDRAKAMSERIRALAA